MANDTPQDFDLGPLTWVHGEIDQAFTRGLDALATFRAAPGDSTPLKQARAHIHQAAGALQMVGLDAVTAYTDEIERQLGRLEELPAADAQATCDLVDRAGRKLKIFLDDLVGGAHPVPLKLFPEYEAMQQARGVKATAPTDLFFPDLSARAPKIAALKSITSQKLPSYLIKQRRSYQRGLLAWLRGDEDSAKVMRDAIQGVEDVQTHASQRSFWWTVGALLESIVEKGVESGFGIKQLCGRVDLQIRRFVEGSGKVSDRMRREVLYYIAISAPTGAQVQAVQRAYDLIGLIPSADVLSADVLRAQPLLRDAKDQLVAAKDLWLKVTGGRPEHLAKLKQVMAGLSDKVNALGEPSLARLVGSLSARLEAAGGKPIAESVAMEYATALLLTESTIERFAKISPDLPQQVDAMLARLDAAQQNKPAPDMAGAPMLDEMARRAQERLLLAQVAREIQANLRHMEQVLDAFFRDHSKRADLATLGNDSRQIAGALKMLGLDRADQLLAFCQQQIEEYAKPETEVRNEDLETLAEALSGLGFYIEAVEQQRPDRERLIDPILEQRLGFTPTAPAVPIETVEMAVSELRAALPATLVAFQNAPDDAQARQRLTVDLTTLHHDAELIGDQQLQAAAAVALARLERGGVGDTAALQDAIAEVAGRQIEAPAPSQETIRLLETDAAQFDTELLDIYLTEADEVLDAVAASAAQLRAHPDDRDALGVSRRGFHTLKGSGRMVGLTALGDLAFAVEKTHNRVIEEDRRVTPAMIELIDVAQRGFRGWVDALRHDGKVTPHAGPLLAALAAVDAEFPVDAAAGLPATAAAMALTLTTPADDPAPFAVAGHPPAQALAAIEVLELDETMPSENDEWNDDSAPPRMTAEIIEFVPSTAVATTLESHALEASAPQDQEEITVGGVTLSGALYRILCDEATQHLATLDSELQNLQFDSAAIPSQLMVRASHTLCGIHRTGGFPLLATTANALELCLLGLQERGAPMSGIAQPVLARAVAGLSTLSARVRAREPFDPTDAVEAAEIIGELDALRQETAPEAGTEDSETVAARVAAADDGAEAHARLSLVPAPAMKRADEDSVPPILDQTPPDAATDRTHDQPPPMAIVRDEPPPAAAPTSPTPSPILADGGAAAAVAVVPLAAPRPVPAPTAPTATTIPTSLAAAVMAKPAATLPEDPLLDVHDDVDRQVLPIFLEEAAELFPQAGEQLRAWRARPSGHDAAQALQRTLHTFKGSARMAGAMRLGQLTHLMESRIGDSDEQTLVTPSLQLFDALDDDLDNIAFLIDSLQKGEVDKDLPQSDAVAAKAGTPGKAGSGVVTPLVVAASSGAPAVPVTAPGAADSEAMRAMLRVRADLIDRLVNEAGEVTIARARVEGELRSLKANLLELTSSVIRLRSQVREIEIQAESQIQSRMSMVNEAAEGFDPLEFDRYTRFQELTRGLAEGVNDVSTVQQALLKNLDEADAALLAQSRLSRDVQQQLFSIRTVPFGSLSERLYRILRQTAKELDKRVNLEIRGTQVELDRSVLEKLVGPLEHLLRNAIDHGIETRDQRRSTGKPETGEITLNVQQQGNEIAIVIVDDGAGIDLPRVRDKARAQNLVPGDAEPTEAQLIGFIFAAGFSTASKVTQISGRGMGMDVVRSEIAALGGRVEVSTTAGKGSVFTLFLPLTLAVAQTVLVRAGGRLWALPAPMVEQVQQIKDKDLLNLYLTREVVWQDRKYPFFYLPRLLGGAGNNPETMRYNSVVLLKSGQNLVAVHIDEMVGNQEVVVKNIGPQLARVSGISGATVLGTGEVVLIINPVQLAQRLDTAAEAPMVVKSPQAAAAAAAAAAKAGPPLVMIVDDSLTVRKITSRLLTREGFKVMTAKDGLDALQLLGERTPDAILLDIEMPRMDGFEFAKTIKADNNFAHIPIIMITSRTADKHRSRAAELGVEVFLGKPYQEDELLRNLREMLQTQPA